MKPRTGFTHITIAQEAIHESNPAQKPGGRCVNAQENACASAFEFRLVAVTLRFALVVRIFLAGPLVDIPLVPDTGKQNDFCRCCRPAH